ncbi:DUF2568 domain-containing protein [Leucobacter tenebrionis]|uniref:DUF2568 domain-containing protein n=1 Tax=Leucobacter tenebrionis TaxID=2873270 RepID=UPI001CA72A13|nr:DUF2568 domain-containing protein [Leucobacter tenebrionis]QZY53074.1 DUF2568 domain-containing protein [Leucobacter tenebrionis]
MTSVSEVQPARTSAILQLVRGLFHLVAVVSVSVWGFVAWPLPFPGLLTGFGFLVLSVLLWALFLSPRPVLRTDRFAQALFELLLLAAAVAALLALGVIWIVPAVYGVAGAVVGFIASTRGA